MMLRHTLIFTLLITTCCISCKKKNTEPPPPTEGNDTSAKKTWSILGNKIAANNANAHAAIAINSDGIPYILYQDGNNSNKATVVKLDNDKWMPVGETGFSDGAAHRPFIVLDNATSLPYAVYIETSPTATNKLNVMHFSGDKWVEVGSTRFQANSTCTPSISLNNTGFPVISFIAPPYTGKVKIFDGSSWADTFTSLPGRRVYDIDVVSGLDYISYLWDTAIGTTQLDVLKNNAGAWTSLNFPGNLYPTSYTIAIGPGNMPFIAIEGKNPLRKATVLRYQGNWNIIGDADFTGGIASEPSLAISNDSVNTPYIAFMDGNQQATIMYYKQGYWNNVGTALPKITASHVSVGINPKDDLPIMAVTNAMDGSITVLCYK